jgi:hypothetical protein
MEIEVKCHTFNNSIRNHKLKVLDVTAPSIQKIYDELYKNAFPIYFTTGYENRVITNGSKPSLHAYGAAIDINEHINPYIDIIKGVSSIEPKRFTDREEDEKNLRSVLVTQGVVDEAELVTTIGFIIQKESSDDWFVNREIHRKGMLSPKEAAIFAKNGFTIWGGEWKQPMDFMHFQIPRKLAERLANISKEEGEVVWANHLLITRWHLKLKRKLEKIGGNHMEEIMADHLKQCQQDGDYFTAANNKETTDICISDCRRKLHYTKKIVGRNRRYML